MAVVKWKSATGKTATSKVPMVIKHSHKGVLSRNLGHSLQDKFREDVSDCFAYEQL